MVQPIDKRLDMVITIATPINSYILSTIVKDNAVPINVYMNHGEIHITFFLDNISTNERTLFASFDPIIVGNVMEITERIDSAVIRTLAENSELVPTLADSEVYVKGKNIFLSFRFHSSDLLSVGKLIRKIVSLNDHLEEIRLTESSGIVEVLNKISKRILLSAVSFSFSKSGTQQFIAEWKAKSKAPMEGISYSLQDARDIKKYDFSKEPTSALIESVFKDHIPLASYVELHENDRVRVIVHVPSCLLKPFLIRLYESLENQSDFRVESIENYGENQTKLSEFHII